MNLLKYISYLKSKSIVLMSGSLIFFMGENKILKMEIKTDKKSNKSCKKHKRSCILCAWESWDLSSKIRAKNLNVDEIVNRSIKILTKYLVIYVWQRDSDRTESHSRT